MSTEDQSLLERIEMPSIPESAMKQIAILEEQFARAEVEQCKFQSPNSCESVGSSYHRAEYHSNKKKLKIMISC
jgi:hypothetical protein